MAERRVKVPDPLGNEIEGTVVEIVSSDEPPIHLKLADGNTLIVRYVATEVIKLDGLRNPQGEPVYIVKSGNVVQLASQ